MVPGGLLELMPGAYVMLCGNRLGLKKNQSCTVMVREADFRKRAVRVAIE
jgi:hypothetical protein